MTIVSEIKEAHHDVAEFLRIELNKIIQNPLIDEILSAHLHPLVSDERYPVVLEKINQTNHSSDILIS